MISNGGSQSGGVPEETVLAYDNPEITSHDEVEVVIPRQVTLHRFSGPVYLKDNQLLGRVEVYYDVTETKKCKVNWRRK